MLFLRKHQQDTLRCQTQNQEADVRVQCCCIGNLAPVSTAYTPTIDRVTNTNGSGSGNTRTRNSMLGP